MLVFKKELHKHFKMINESFKKFLGIEISWPDKNTISLSQTMFIEEILKYFDIKNSAPVPTFIMKSLQLDLKFIGSSFTNINKKHY